MPDYELVYRFTAIPAKGDPSDLILDCTLRQKYGAETMPSEPDPPQITIHRVRSKVAPGRLSVVSGSESRSENGTLTILLSGTPRLALNERKWDFQVKTETVSDLALRFHAHPKGTSAPAWTDPHHLWTTPSVTNARLHFNPATPKDQAPRVTLSLEPFPRLVVGLNSGKPNPIRTCDPSSGLVADFAILLEDIHARLKEGLASAWGGTQAMMAPTGAQIDQSRPLSDANEKWANQVAEMLTLQPYAGPGAAYALSESRLVAAGLSEEVQNPYYPMTSACQQLCSFALASRGYTFQLTNKYLRLLNAGSSVRRTWVETFKGKWVTAKDATDPILLDGKPPEPAPEDKQKQTDPKSQSHQKKAAPNPIDSMELPNSALRSAPMLFRIHEKDPSVAFGPGSIFLYSNRPVKPASTTTTIEGQYENTVTENGDQEKWRIAPDNIHLADNTAGAHLGFVLRADWASKTFQVFDTGGLGVSGWSNGVKALNENTNGGFHAGIFDGPACTEVGKGSDPFRGVGVLPFSSSPEDQKKEAEHINFHVENILKKARPLGLARLFLMKRGAKVQPGNVWNFKKQEWLMYASPTMLTWESNQYDNYSIARYLWSLRDLPSSNELQAMWVIYTPQRQLAETMLESNRTETLDEILEKTFQRLPEKRRKALESPPKTGGPFSRNARLLARLSVPVTNLTHRNDGSVFVSATIRKFAKMHPLYMLEGRWGEPALPMTEAYLIGAQSDSAFPDYFRPVKAKA